jgi:hypothetical protein
MKFQILSIVILTFVLISSCKKENSSENTTPTQPAPAKKSVKPVTKPDLPKTKEEVKPEIDSKLATLVPGKGIRNLLLDGMKETIDVLLGVPMGNLTNPLAIEIGEDGTKIERPIRFTYGGHSFKGDGHDKLGMVSFALAEITIPLIISKKSVNFSKLSLTEISKVMSNCTKKDKKLICHEGKTVFSSDAKGLVTLTFSTIK